MFKERDFFSDPRHPRKSAAKISCFIFDLKRKTALVTGAASGIDETIAAALENRRRPGGAEMTTHPASRPS